MAIMSETTEQISIIKFPLESTHQIVSNDISYIISKSVFIEIQYQYSDIISYISLTSAIIDVSTTRYKFWLYNRNSLSTDYHYFA